MAKLKSIKIWLLIIPALIIFYVISFCIYIQFYSSLSSLKKVDVIIVLGARQHNCIASNVLRKRTEYAIKLFQDDYAKRLIFTGGVAKGETCSEASVSRDIAVNEYRIDPRKIKIEERSVNTHENLLFSRVIMYEEGDKAAIVVSDAFHLMRAVYLAERLDMKVLPSATNPSAFQSPYTIVPHLLTEFRLMHQGFINEIFSSIEGD